MTTTDPSTVTKQRAFEIARDLIAEHLPNTEWRFAWDDGVRRLGCCHYSKKTISLSRWLIERCTEKDVRETVLHEIAHAKAPGDAHGYRWASECFKLGIPAERCHSVKTIPGRYRATCSDCGRKFNRHRNPGDLWCKCNGRASGYDPEKRLRWKDVGDDPIFG